MAKQKVRPIVSPVATSAYAWLARPDEGQEFSDGKYKVTLVLDKGDKEAKDFIADITREAEALAKKAWDAVPKNMRYPFKDGDDSEKEEFHGKWLLTAKTKFQPGFVDQFNKQIDEEDIPSSGDLIQASFSLKEYATGGGKGVTSQLRNVRLIEKRNTSSGASNDFGDPIDTPSESDNDFDIAI